MNFNTSSPYFTMADEDITSQTFPLDCSDESYTRDLKLEKFDGKSNSFSEWLAHFKLIATLKNYPLRLNQCFSYQHSRENLLLSRRASQTRRLALLVRVFVPLNFAWGIQRLRKTLRFRRNAGNGNAMNHRSHLRIP